MTEKLELDILELPKIEGKEENGDKLLELMNINPRNIFKIGTEKKMERKNEQLKGRIDKAIEYINSKYINEYDTILTYYEMEAGEKVYE